MEIYPQIYIYIYVSKNSGTPKWMVKIVENPIEMDDLGGTIIFGNTHINFLMHGWNIQ